MKITRINIESKETKGGSSFDLDVTRIDTGWHAKQKGAEKHYIDCDIDIELAGGEGVRFAVTVPYIKGGTLARQWESIIKEARSSLDEAINGLPSPDLSDYVDLVETPTEARK